MVTLSGKNLGERQRDLNNKVSEVLSKKQKFDDIKNEEEKSDIDKLYKIDIASQYYDVDYIIEVLKSGDELFITRALKCLWLYDDKYSYIFNPENLRANLFPYMSVQMKKKMLSIISTYVQDKGSAENFYVYCVNNNMPKIAVKFLNASSEEFKINFFKNDPTFSVLTFLDTEIKMQNFVGNSFELGLMVIKASPYQITDTIHKLRHLYTVDNVKYLDILENYSPDLHDCVLYNLKPFGVKISRDILLKHKGRVLEHPLLYIHKLNKGMLVKYSNVDDAKIYINSLLPESVNAFWHTNFCTEYKFILNIVPMKERLDYIKQLYITKYPGEPFEMNIDFYKAGYHKLMSIENRERWALANIAEKKEHFGKGNDYMWYQFVSLSNAFTDLKNYIMITPDRCTRLCIINVLVETARDQNDIKKVLDYYYDRHVNEKDDNKRNFIDKVLDEHNVFEFNSECWEALNKLFHSLGLYRTNSYSNNHYIAVAIFYHALHEIDMPPTLLNFLDIDVNYTYFHSLLPKLDKEKSEIILQNLVNIMTDKLQSLEKNLTKDKDVLQSELKIYANNAISISALFDKSNEDSPDIVKKYLQIESEPKNAKDILHLIKTDVTKLVDVLQNSEITIYGFPVMERQILKKIKLYFPGHIAEAYLNCLYRNLEAASDEYYSSRIINAVIFGIFQLADESEKIALMEKYHPTAAKIDHASIDGKLLYIQQAICKFMGYSRPPLPLKSVIPYIKGDYVHYCLPIFKIYSESLPLPLVAKFTETMLNKPLSIKKHALRLAFKCYDIDRLKTLLLNTWKKTKNVTLRKIIYESLFHKLAQDKDHTDKDAKTLYEDLKFFTLDLRDTDPEKIFRLITSNKLPDAFKDDYLQTAWNVVTKFPNIDRQIMILTCLQHNCKVVQRDFVRKIIDEHVNKLSLEMSSLITAKWELTANYIVNYSNNEELEQNLALMRSIIIPCLQMWEVVQSNVYVYRKFYSELVEHIENKSELVKCNRSHIQTCTVPIFEGLLDLLEKELPLKMMYLEYWNLQLSILIGLSFYDRKVALKDDKLRYLNNEDISILGEAIGIRIGNLMQELLNKNLLYTVFLSEIANILKNKFFRLNNTFSEIYICKSLANISLKEAHLLALLMLPKDDVANQNKLLAYNCTLDRIRAFKNEEVHTFLHYLTQLTYTES